MMMLEPTTSEAVRIPMVSRLLALSS